MILSAENKAMGGQNLIKESVEGMIGYFCLNKLINSNIATTFLGRMVHNKAVLDQVKMLLEVLAIVVITQDMPDSMVMVVTSCHFLIF